jgi:DNA-binding NtrC family response regulator
MSIALLVDDDPGTLRALRDVVEREGFEVRTAETLRGARSELFEPIPDLVLIDLHLPDGTGLDLLEDLRDHRDTEVVFVTGQGTIDTAVEAMRSGAVDYLTKPVDLPRLRKVLLNVQRNFDLRQEIETLRGELRILGRFGSIVGASPAMQGVFDQLEKVSTTDITVLLTGETGTGKDLAARTIHELSRRSRKPFLPVNCGAVPANLIESEIFGHERGSFTGASGRHTGMFERADGGTLFLDEITEMPLELQVKLLRILETGELTRVGGTRSIHVDVRVIAATNRSPEEAVAVGQLRQDLFYRLMVFPIEIPPLRERESDVELLARRFLDDLNRREGTTKRFAPATTALIRTHRWPGNVRELKNAVERAFILSGEEILPRHVPIPGAPADPAAAPRNGPGSVQVEIGTSIDESERRLILATLDHHGGDKKRTASVLGVSLRTLYNKLRRYKLSRARHS